MMGCEEDGTEPRSGGTSQQRRMRASVRVAEALLRPGQHEPLTLRV